MCRLVVLSWGGAKLFEPVAVRGTSWPAIVFAVSVALSIHAVQRQISAVAALPPVIRIGAVFTEEQRSSAVELAFRYAVSRINRDKTVLPNTQLVYDIRYVPATDSFRGSNMVCNQVEKGVQGIFGPADATLSAHIQSICDALDIPFLQSRVDLEAEAMDQMDDPAPNGDQKQPEPDGDKTEAVDSDDFQSDPDVADGRSESKAALVVSTVGMANATRSRLHRRTSPATAAASIANHNPPHQHQQSRTPRPFSINLYPDAALLNRAVVDLMRFLNWSQVAVICEPSHGLLRLRQLVRTPGLEVHVRRADRRTYAVVLAELKAKEHYHLLVDTRAAHMRQLLAAIMQLQMNEYKYHYLFTTFDIDTLDLEDLKYNFVNITAFRLVDVEDIGVREQLKDMERFARRKGWRDDQEAPRQDMSDHRGVVRQAAKRIGGANRAGGMREAWHRMVDREEGREVVDDEDDGRATRADGSEEDEETSQNWSEGGVADAGGVRFIQTEPALIYDSVHVFAVGLQTLDQSHALRASNASCTAERPWDDGLSLINYINAVEWKGLTGPIEFKEGARTRFRLDLVKLKPHAIVKVGEWTPAAGLNVSDRAVFFDAGKMNVTLVVITILESPYVQMHYGKNFTGNQRFFGFCVDILDRVAHEVGFDYILDLVPDRKYGAKDPVSGEWNGMVAQLMKHEFPYVMQRPSSSSTTNDNEDDATSEDEIDDLVAPALRRSFFYRQLQQQNRQQPPIVAAPANASATGEDSDAGDGPEHFEGFCIDLLRHVARIVGFEYRIRLVPDGKYGVFDPRTGEWNGIVRQLMDKKADLAVGSMTINYARESVIDFTKPFMNLGISILFKVPTSAPTRLFSFMTPLAVDIWLFVLAAYVCVSLTIHLVARFSPYEWHMAPACDVHTSVAATAGSATATAAAPPTAINQFTVANSFWFAIGTLMQQGSDLNPRANSTRIVGGMWWFFTLIMISSYTANLAAFLTVERMITPIENAEDLAGQTEIAYGTLESGSTMTFFRDSMIETYKKMWRFMENKKPSAFTSTYEEGIRRVLDGNYAFLMESTMLDYIVQRDCNLTQIGGLLDTKGYGIATPMGSPWRDRISLAILELQEKGDIQMLYDKWWKVPGDQCVRATADRQSKESKANALGVDNIGGVFVVLLAGLGVAVLVAVAEFCANYRRVRLRDGRRCEAARVSGAERMMMVVAGGEVIHLDAVAAKDGTATAIAAAERRSCADGTVRQSLCAEMTEELCFAVRCRGSRQRPALKRTCSQCVAVQAAEAEALQLQRQRQMDERVAAVAASAQRLLQLNGNNNDYGDDDGDNNRHTADAAEAMPLT